MAQSLKELKEENAKLSLESADIPQTAGNEYDEDDAGEVEHVVHDDKAESESASSKQTESESWMQSEEEVEALHEGKDVPLAAHIKLRAKLKGKLDDKEMELKTLREEVESLKSGIKPAAALSGKPKREDFFSSDDPEEAYLDAMLEWKSIQSGKSREQEDMARKQREAQERLNKQVDEHYLRAAKLAAENGISDEVYRSADQKVRETLDAAMPGYGDMVAENIIATVGEGSEKVMYHLGRNPSKLKALKDSFLSDPTGLKAAVMIGEIKGDLTFAAKKKTQAPTPAPSIKGDEGLSASDTALYRKYKEAHSKGNSQLAFQIKRQAKASNVNTREW